MREHCYDYPRPAVTADVCLFTLVEDKLQILLIQRGDKPFKDSWALPGGLLRQTESLGQCAARELKDKTGVTGVHLEAFATFSDPRRDPRERVVSAAYLGIVPAEERSQRPESNPENTHWHNLLELPELAFDHSDIITTAHQKLIARLNQEPLFTAFLSPRFTLAQIQKVYAAVQGRTAVTRNFRRSILAKGWIRDTGTFDREGTEAALLYEKI